MAFEVFVRGDGGVPKIADWAVKLDFCALVRYWEGFGELPEPYDCRFWTV